MNRLSATCFVSLLIAAAARAQVNPPAEAFEFDADQPASGAWMGNITNDQSEVMRVLQVFVTKDDAGEWTVEAASIDMGLLSTNCSDVVIDGRDISFKIPAANKAMELAGRVSDDGQRLDLSGAITPAAEGEDPPALAAKLFRTIRPLDLPDPQAFTGKLQGFLAMTFVFAKTPGGNLVGHLDVPPQTVREALLYNITESEDGTITAKVPAPGDPALRARIEAGGQRLAGTFTQAGFEFPINFGLVPDYKWRDLARPQHPEPPFPYETFEFTAPHPEGFSLTGTLTIPDREDFGDGPFPTAVLISGSGQQDRDETLLGHKPFLVIADYLTRHGLAVARFDDRGVGGSLIKDDEFERLVENATSADFATDARAVVNAIRSQPGVDPDRIGLLGHSEGGLIAPMVANDGRDDIAFVILLAAPGVPGDQLLNLQLARQFEARGMKPEHIAEFRTRFEKLQNLIIRDAPEEDIRAEMKNIEKFWEETGLEEGVKRIEGADENESIGFEFLTNPWMKFFFTYDPAPALAKLECPVLAMNGTKDLQVWHEQNLDTIERIMREAGRDVTIVRCEGLNHLFQPAETGAAEEYAVIETTFDESALQKIVDWINSKVGGSSPP